MLGAATSGTRSALRRMAEDAAQPVPLVARYGPEEKWELVPPAGQFGEGVAGEIRQKPRDITIVWFRSHGKDTDAYASGQTSAL
jgi:hypothetical protein